MNFVALMIVGFLAWFLIGPLIMGGGSREVKESFVGMLFVVALGIGWVVIGTYWGGK